MDDLWRLTQTPELHRRWDLRFTDIEYLPRPDEAEPQRFLYATRIGFGWDSHEFRAGIPLKIGGVTLAHNKGLGGHSDGDDLTLRSIEGIAFYVRWLLKGANGTVRCAISTCLHCAAVRCCFDRGGQR